MFLSEMQGKVVPIKLWSPIDRVESAALDQLKNIASLPWAFHHVAVMFLNQTSARQVWPLLNGFFERWPDEYHAALADIDHLAEYIKPLGLQNRRARSIRQMSFEYVMLDGKIGDPKELHGIGKYGSDSYRIFVIGELVEDVKDKELRKYLTWAKERIAHERTYQGSSPRDPGADEPRDVPADVAPDVQALA